MLPQTPTAGCLAEAALTQRCTHPPTQQKCTNAVSLPPSLFAPAFICFKSRGDDLTGNCPHPEMCCPDGLPRDQASGPHGPGIKNGIRIHTVTRLPTTATRNSLNCLRAHAHAHAHTPPCTSAHTNKNGDTRTASQTTGLLTQYSV